MVIIRGVQIVVHRHRIAVDRRRVQRGVGALVQRDPAQGLPGGAVAVKVALRVERQRVSGRGRSERRLPTVDAGPARRGDLALLHQLLERRLPQRAEAQHVACHAGGDGHHRGDHRPAGAEGVHAAVDPRRPDAQRALQRGDSRLRPSPSCPSPDTLRDRRCRPASDPASAIAASQASMVSDNGGTISRRPSLDAPIPVMAAASSNFSRVSIGRTNLPKSCGAISSSGSAPVSARRSA